MHRKVSAYPAGVLSVRAHRFPGCEPHPRYVLPSRKRRRFRRMFALLLVAAALLASCAAFGQQRLFVGGVSSVGDVSVAAGGIGTPRSQWERGSIPYLYQIDAAWGEKPYAGTDVATAGCGPTCMAMVYIGLTGKTDCDPAAMAAFAEREGYVESGMTTWLFMTEGAKSLGLSAEELPADEGALLDALRTGRPVIASVRPGDFTTVGHFIVLAGVDDAGGISVRDPNSPERSARSWDARRILSQCANLWAFEPR